MSPRSRGPVLESVARPARRPADRAQATAWSLPRWLVGEQANSFILVLVVASALRLPFPDLTPFGHDEALEAERARPIWYGARPVDSEVTSWFIPDPAGLLYFFSLAEAFPRPAIARVVQMSAINVVSVGLCYLLARRFFGARVGLIAGLLYAVNPWAATFARQPWVITQPLLTTLMLFSAMMVVARRDRRWIVPFFLAGAAQTQTHLLAVLYGPPVLLTLVLFWRRWLAPHVVAAILAAVALVAPYALHIWAIRDEIMAALSRGNRGITLVPNDMAVTLSTWLISGYNLDRKLGFPAPWLDALSMPLLVVAVLASALVLVGVGVGIRACVRRRDGWETDALLLIWLLAPLALMSFQGSQVYIHYVLCLVPVPFLVMARGADWLGWKSLAASPFPARGGGEHETASASLPLRTGEGLGILEALRPRIVLTVLTGALLTQVAALLAFYAAIEGIASAPPAAISATDWQLNLNREDLKARQLGIGELHGLPLRYWQTVADQAHDVSRSSGLHAITVVTGIVDDANRHLDRRRKALSYLLGPDLEVRFPLEGLTVVPMTTDTLFLTVPDQDLPRVIQRAATKQVEIVQPGTSAAARIYRVRTRPLDEVVTLRRRANVPVEDGVRLLVLDVPPDVRAGQTAGLVAYLQVDDASRLVAGRVPFVELLGQDGQRRVVVRRGGLDTADWRTGDLLIQQLSLTVPVDLPPGEYQLRLGLADASASAADKSDPASSLMAIPAATLRVRSSQ